MESLVLKATETWSPNHENPIEIHSSAGILWITEEGAIQDIILHSGDSFRMRGNGKLVVQAITDAKIQVETQAPNPSKIIHFPILLRMKYGSGLPIPPGKGRRSFLSQIKH